MWKYQTFSVTGEHDHHENNVGNEKEGNENHFQWIPRTAQDYVGMDEQFDDCEALEDQGGLEGLERLGWTGRHDEMAE